MSELKFWGFKMTYNNRFLILMAVIFYTISWFTTSWVPSFLWGLCFGFIYLNYKDEKNNS